MKMLYDDINGVYVWVDSLNEDIQLSPHFDYEEDAIQWYNNIACKICPKVTPKKM